MAGHSKWANIKHRKGAQDAKRASLFTKLTKEITVAAKSGQPDPEFNPRLRSAFIAAKRAGVPKDRIDTALKKGSGEIAGENYEEVRYEGYGPGGVAIIIEALTDNRNRTAPDLRASFTKHGGNLGENGSVSFMFEQLGILEYPAATASADAMFEAAAEAGADNVESSDEWHEVTCQPDLFSQVRDGLIKKFGDPETAQLGWRARDPMDLDFEKAERIVKLVEALEDNDDVQNVYGSYAIADDVAEKLSNM